MNERIKELAEQAERLAEETLQKHFGVDGDQVVLG